MNPQSHTNGNRDLPRAIMLSLGVCVALYCAVCLVITGMVPYDQIDLSAPLSSAFKGCASSVLSSQHPPQYTYKHPSSLPPHTTGSA